jgi:hypothetical protein
LKSFAALIREMGVAEFAPAELSAAFARGSLSGVWADAAVANARKQANARRTGEKKRRIRFMAEGAVGGTAPKVFERR